MKYIFIIIFMILCLFVVNSFGAMTREQICVEQSNLTSQGKDQTGVNVWLPCGTTDNEWILHVMTSHATGVDGVSCWVHGESYITKCVAGSYMPCLVGGSGFAFPSGNWSSGSITYTTGSNGWRYAQNKTITDRNMRLTVPANTTRLYMIGYADNDFGTMLVTTVSGTATIVKSSWDLDLNGGSCDFTLDTLVTTAGPKYSSGAMKLLATNCGGAVLNFIGAGEAGSRNAVGLCGFIAINDNGDVAEFNPYDGVFDPEHITEVMMYEFSGYHQEADGPLALNASGANGKWWGLGHWDADDTLINESQTIYYQDVDDNAWVDWTSVDTDETHVRKKAWSFGRTLKGDMQLDVGGTDYNIGTHTSIYSFNPSGLTITLDHLFNAEAETKVLGFADRGGYGGQWTLAKGFAKYIRSLPAINSNAPYVINTGAFTDNSVVFSKLGNFVGAYGGNYEVHIQGEGTILSGGGTIMKTSPYIFGVERKDVLGNEGFKLYFNNKYEQSTLAITAGDRAFSKHTRIITPQNGLRTSGQTKNRMQIFGN